MVLQASERATDDGSALFRGRLERLSEQEGLTGWLLDLNHPARRHRLRLVANGRAIAETETTIFRDDLTLATAPEMTPGFQFKPADFLPILELQSNERPTRLTVEVVGTPEIVRGPLALLTNQVVRIAQKAAERRDDAAHVSPHDFLLALQDRRSVAGALFSRPMRPRMAPEIGFVEMVCPLSSDLCLLVGWIKESQPIDFSAVLVSGERYPAGMRGFTFNRPDLTGRMCGFAALVRVEWRPVAGSAFFIYWDAGGLRQVRSGGGWRLIAPEEARTWLAALRGQAASSDIDQIDRSLSMLDNWEPSMAAAAQAGVKWGMDRLLILPGFGAFLQGWIVSPRRQLMPASLRFGDQVLQGNASFLSRHPRNDLGDVQGLASDPTSLATAGFTALFNGGTADAWIGRPLLKLNDAHAEEFVLSLEAGSTRLCEGSDCLEALADACPSLMHEPFFEEVLDTFGEIARRRASTVGVSRAARIERAVVICLPAAPDDMRLTFDKVATFLGDFPPDVGVALLCSPKQDRSRLLTLVAAVARATSRPVALLQVADPLYVLWSLPSVLAMLGCQDFWFLAPTVTPTRHGWDAAADRFRDKRGELELFIDAGPHSGANPLPSSLSFAWSTAKLVSWERTAPFFLSGFFEDNGLPPRTIVREHTIKPLVVSTVPEAIRRCDIRISEDRKDRLATRAA